MSHNALVVQVMVSSPSDLPEAHMAIIHSAMRTWNVEHGKIYGIHFNPTDWSEGASPAFGDYAQKVLNEQIVDESDMAIVIFTDRMGTPTPEHPSGTAEEIARFKESGKDVGIFRNNTSRRPLAGSSALEQKQKLEEYIASIYDGAYVSGYESTDELRTKTSRLLTHLAGKMRREADAGLILNSAPAQRPLAAEENLQENESPDPSKGVWPRVEVESYSETDSKGRLKTKRRWYLVLESNIDVPVKEVNFYYEDGRGNAVDDFSVVDTRGDDDYAIDVLPPRGSYKFGIFQAMSSPGSAMCVVTWKTMEGEERETRASVRTTG